MGYDSCNAQAALRVFERTRPQRVLKKNAAYLARIDKTKWRIVVQDESIFVYDVKLRKTWVVKGSKPIVLTTGSHRRTCVFGALADDGTQLFRQKKNCDTENFLPCADELRRKYPFMVLFLDKAAWHKTDERIKAYWRKHRATVRIRWFPSGFPEANPVEESWRQGKGSELGCVFPESFEQFKKSVDEYYRTKRFKLNLYNYLCHQL